MGPGRIVSKEEERLTSTSATPATKRTRRGWRLGSTAAGRPGAGESPGGWATGSEVRWWDTWLAPGFVAVAVLASLLLAAMLFFVHRSIDAAGIVLARGDGAQLAEAVQEALRRGPKPPRATTLEEVLAQRAQDGLRYVAVLSPGNGSVEISAGEPLRPVTPDAVAVLHAMEPVVVGDRMRMFVGPAEPPGVKRPRPPLPPRGPARYPPGPGGPPDVPLDGPPDGPPHGGPPDGMRPPGFGPGGPPPLRLVIEFEPLAAQQLLQVARRTLLAGVVTVPVFVGCALLLAFLTRQRNHLVRRLEHGRRLAALGEMSAVLAHEIRNPLASLKGHAQLLARSLDGDAARAAKADLVVREAVRLQDLATDLLDFAGSGVADLAPVDPALLLRESVETVDAARIAVETGGAPSSWPLDATRTRQALVNVLRNAVQASPEGTRVEASAFLERERLVFEVRDHGAGIPPGDEERIFEPFHTRKLRGTGLGLAIARRVVEQQGGSIVARNLPGGGACFRIVIART